MSNFLIKGHHAIMKLDAEYDYNIVSDYLRSINKSENIKLPKGKHWHKIEDATACMLRGIDQGFNLVLRRGITYYMKL